MMTSTIEKCKGDDASLAEAAAFFVDSFWASGTTTSAVELSDAEREQLCKQQTDDVRYSFLLSGSSLTDRVEPDPVVSHLALLFSEAAREKRLRIALQVLQVTGHPSIPNVRRFTRHDG